MSETRYINRNGGDNSNRRVSAGSWDPNAKGGDFGAEAEDIPLGNGETVPVARPGFPRQDPPAPNQDAFVPFPTPENSGETIVYRRSRQTAEEPEFIKDSSEWPVAVLVVIGGRMKGEILPVLPGRSTLGRGLSNRIVMANDEFVSKENHIILTHYADDNAFVVSLGTGGSGVAYLNDKRVVGPVELANGDRIRLTNRTGNPNPTELLFIAICGEINGRSFNWFPTQD